MFLADMHNGRVAVTRGKLIETDDSGEFQQLKFAGLKGQTYTKIGRNQQFGMASHAPPGAIGHFMTVAGRQDQAWALGYEHPDHRPKNLGEGHTAIYDAHGNIVSLVGNKIRHVSAVHEFVGDITITGNITMTGNFTQSGVHLDSNGPHTA